MRNTPPHQQVLEEVERDVIPGLLELLSEEGLDDISLIVSTITALKQNLTPRR
jgi:hypothetical protein